MGAALRGVASGHTIRRTGWGCLIPTVRCRTVTGAPPECERLAATLEIAARRRASGLEIRGLNSGVPARTIARSAEFKGAARRGSRATTAIRVWEPDEHNLPIAVCQRKMIMSYLRKVEMSC